MFTLYNVLLMYLKKIRSDKYTYRLKLIKYVDSLP